MHLPDLALLAFPTYPCMPHFYKIIQISAIANKCHLSLRIYYHPRPFSAHKSLEAYRIEQNLNCFLWVVFLCNTNIYILISLGGLQNILSYITSHNLVRLQDRQDHFLKVQEVKSLFRVTQFFPTQSNLELRYSYSSLLKGRRFSTLLK